MKIIECVQLSPEWWEARRGIPTASAANRILTPNGAEPKFSCVTTDGETCGTRHGRRDVAEKCAKACSKKSGKEFIVSELPLEMAAGAEEYINELIADSVRLDPNLLTENPSTPAMRHGTDCEPRARSYYEMDRGVTVQQVGLCLTDDGTLGSSPDFLVGDDATGGAGELKCPQPKTHVAYLRAGVLPDEYFSQCHMHLIVTGRAYCDFMSYCDGFPPLLVRVEPNDYTKKLRVVLKEFWTRYSAAKAQVLAML